MFRGRRDAKTAQQPAETAWHSLSESATAEALATDLEQGLSRQAVERGRGHHGPNRLARKKGKSALLLFLSQLHQPLVYILLIAGTVTAFLEEWVDSGVIFGVVLVNAIIGFIQEANALKAIDALARGMSVSATVIRDGVKQIVAAEDLVPGDVVVLQSGDKVAADLRLLYSRELQVDESALTGESLPVAKQTEPLATNTLLAERSNRAYASTLVTYGIGTGVVVATGDSTEIGRINRMIASAETLETPLTQKMTQFSKLLMWVIIGFALLTFVIGWLRGGSVLDMFMAAVALAVGAIPEGLPAALTITLAIGVSRMAKRHAIIRKLPAVETLGSTTLICSDKTGTLTQNQMTVHAIFVGGETFAVTGSGYTPDGDFLRQGETVIPSEHPALNECLKAGLLCNDARLLAGEEAWSIEGDPTEGALLVVAHKAGMHWSAVENSHPRIDAIPFESRHQFMATLHDNPAADVRHVYIKGAVESVLQRCHGAFDANLQPQALDAAMIISQVEAMAAQGLRVLAFARGDVAANTDRLDLLHVADGLIFLGLQAMMDPPRPEAAASVRACHAAGIRVKMITGDHLVTAKAIAAQLDLTGGMATEIMALDGRQLEAMSDADLNSVIEQTVVFARVAPEQKLRLVEMLQARGHIVAMTGDGVNDAPALRQANIGVAMGVAGTEVAKEAADMVLTDDNFATIQAAVEEGRGVFDNLTKFITWTLPTNLGEGLVIMAAILAGVELPIMPVQILWINMTTAVLLGLMLAFEPKEPGLMARPPRNPGTPILTGSLVFRIFSVGVWLLVGAFGLFEWVLSQGRTLAEARTVAVNVFVFGEFFYLFNCRSLHYSMFRVGVFSNPWVLCGAATMAGLQALFTHNAVMNTWFDSVPIGREDWLLVLGAGFAIYVAVGIEKWLTRRLTLRLSNKS